MIKINGDQITHKSSPTETNRALYSKASKRFVNEEQTNLSYYSIIFQLNSPYVL